MKKFFVITPPFDRLDVDAVADEFDTREEAEEAALDHVKSNPEDEDKVFVTQTISRPVVTAKCVEV